MKRFGVIVFVGLLLSQIPANAFLFELLIGGGLVYGAADHFYTYAHDQLAENEAAIAAYMAAHSPIPAPKVEYINIDDFPETRDMLGIESPDGPFAMLVEDYTFYNLDGTAVTIPKGFIYDGASIPELATHIIDGKSFSEDMLAPGLIHDYMYRCSGYTKEYADMMIAVNAYMTGNKNPLEIWGGLYYGGFVAYNGHQRRRDNDEYSAFDNVMNGRDYYANNYARYLELRGKWTDAQVNDREGPTVFRDIWSQMNDLGLLKDCLGGDAWKYSLDKVTVLATSESSNASGFGTSAGNHSTIEILAGQQPSLNYGSSFADPTSADAKNAIAAAHELFLAHMYQINPWAMVGSSFSVNSEFNQGFAAVMTWLYAQKQGIDFEAFSSNMMDANAKGNDMSGTFKSFLKSVMPDADVSTAEGLASAANRLSADMVYDYVNKKAAGIEVVSRMQIREILGAKERVGDDWKETLTDNIMAMVNKGADPWTAYEYAKAVAKNKYDKAQAAFAKMQSEMKASQREQCNSCANKPTSPSPGEGSGNGDGHGNGGDANGSGKPGSGSGGGGEGGADPGAGEGPGPGYGTDPGVGIVDPGYGLPVITTPLPDFGLPNVDGTVSWDKFIGFEVPYDRALFLLSGDLPVGEDLSGAWSGLVDMFDKELDWEKFNFSNMWSSWTEKIGTISFDDVSEAIEKNGKVR